MRVVVTIAIAAAALALASVRTARADAGAVAAAGGGAGSGASSGSGGGSGSDTSAGTSTVGFRADKGAFGVGIVLGEPTGISAKLYLADDRAIAVTAGAEFITGGLSLSGDYLFHPAILQDRDSFVMPFYAGPGLRLMDYTGDRGYFAAGLRGVIGLAFDFKQAPIDAFVEAAVVVETGFSSGHGLAGGIDGGVGVRYYF